ncbi:MAG: glycoside hydrolase family 44 protein [Frankiaceae bacterium]
MPPRTRRRAIRSPAASRGPASRASSPSTLGTPTGGNGRDKSGKPLPGAVVSDTSVPAGPDFVAGHVNHLVSAHSRASASGVKIYELEIYELDNEPGLWNTTHRDVHPAPLSYDELVNRTTSYAAAVKSADSSAATLGPSDWGWCAYFYSATDSGGCGPGADRTAHGNVDLSRYYLRKLKAYADAHGGQRLLDYFDEHYYPQAPGVALGPAGAAATQARRLRSTRSSWDPTHTDESWIGTDVKAPPL